MPAYKPRQLNTQGEAMRRMRAAKKGYPVFRQPLTEYAVSMIRLLIDSNKPFTIVIKPKRSN